VRLYLRDGTEALGRARHREGPQDGPTCANALSLDLSIQVKNELGLVGFRIHERTCWTRLTDRIRQPCAILGARAPFRWYPNLESAFASFVSNHSGDFPGVGKACQELPSQAPTSLGTVVQGAVTVPLTVQ
jgi:hypothetical protein